MNVAQSKNMTKCALLNLDRLSISVLLDLLRRCLDTIHRIRLTEPYCGYVIGFSTMVCSQ